jgi:hypothetical protein
VGVHAFEDAVEETYGLDDVGADRYKPFGVHKFLLKLWFISPAFSGNKLMGAN